MGFGAQHYILEVRDQRSLGSTSSDGVITSGVLVFIYDAGTKTLSTIYGSEALSAKTNPISRAQFATDTKVDFWSLKTSHDIFIAHSDGSVARYVGITPQSHTLPLDRDGLDKCMVFPMVFNAGGTETDTGLDLPYSSAVTDIALEVVTVDATETAAIGLLSTETAGDADGLMIATSVANAGIFGAVGITVGSNETFISAARKGALFGAGSNGTDVANDFGQPGGSAHYVVSANATSISYTPSTSDTFAGYGYVFFRHLR